MGSGLHAFLLRIKTLFRLRRMDRDMAEELEFHQSMLRDKLLRQGVSKVEADEAAHHIFGNAGRWHERLRELWQFRGLENFLRDISFSARMLKKSPGFTTVALLTLAIGIGANTAIFSLINGLLLRPLPVSHADQLVVLQIHEGDPEPGYNFSSPIFRGLEQQHTIFSDVFAYFTGAPLQVRGRTGNEVIQGVMVSGQYFRALQTPPLMGRYLTPADDQPGGNTEGFAVVISRHFWQRWFNGAPNVVGRKLVIANVPFTVVGVMPTKFFGADPTQRPEVYVPLSTEPILDAPYNMTAGGIHANWLKVMARLKPGVSLQQANAALLPLSMPIVREQVSDADWIANAEQTHYHFMAVPGAKGFTYVRALFRKPLLAMFAMCGGILAARLSEPGKPVDGAQRGKRTRIGDSTSIGRDEKPADPAIAGGESATCICGHHGGPGRVTPGKPILDHNDASRLLHRIHRHLHRYARLPICRRDCVAGHLLDRACPRTASHRGEPERSH